MKIKYLFAIIISFLSFCPAISAQDWPQFLGPDRNSTSPQKGLLRRWPESGPEVLWAVNVGIGYGSPVIKNGKAYLLDREDGVCDIMRCFDLQTGNELWRFTYDAPGTLPFPGSRSIPIVDDSHVYSVGTNGDLYCIDVNTHQPIWHKNVWTDFGGENLPTWGIAQNPIIYGNMLVVASQAPQAGVVAYKPQGCENRRRRPDCVYYLFDCGSWRQSGNKGQCDWIGTLFGKNSVAIFKLGLCRSSTMRC